MMDAELRGGLTEGEAVRHQAEEAAFGEVVEGERAAAAERAGGDRSQGSGRAERVAVEETERGRESIAATRFRVEYLLRKRLPTPWARVVRRVFEVHGDLIRTIRRFVR